MKAPCIITLQNDERKKENARKRIGVSKLFTTKEKAQGTNNENGKSVMTTPVLLKEKEQLLQTLQTEQEARKGIEAEYERIKKQLQEREEAYTILLNESNQLSEKKWEVEAELRKLKLESARQKKQLKWNGNIAWNVKQEHKR